MATKYAVTAKVCGGRVSATLDAAPVGLGKLRASVAYDHYYDDLTNVVNGVSAAVDKLSVETGMDMRFTTIGAAKIAHNRHCVIVHVYVVEEGALR